MNIAETRLKLLEITRPNNSDPDANYWINKAKKLEEYVTGPASAPAAEAATVAKNSKPAGTTQKASAPAA